MSSFMDAPPPKGAFITRYNMVYYSGDLSVNEPLPIAGLQTWALMPPPGRMA